MNLNVADWCAATSLLIVIAVLIVLQVNDKLKLAVGDGFWRDEQSDGTAKD